MAKTKRSVSRLAMTAEDHLAIGSTPSKDLSDNPGKKFHELLNDEALRNFIANEVMTLAVQHQRALSGDPREVKLLEVQLNGFFAPNIAYLKEIGRIPEELRDFDPETAFALTGGKR